MQYSFLVEKSGGSNEPEFVEDIKNVTVASGREAVISCVVSNLGKYKVGWIRAEDQTILTLDSKVVTHNSRVSVTHDGVQTWNLHLRQVKESDKGCYMCQINTAIMKKQLGCIDVHVSPTIIDEETSADVTAREGDNVTLVCRATGRPPPKIIWKREDGAKILVRRGLREAFKGYDNITGETLHFVRVDRKMQGAHFCLASNGVPPTKSKRIVLDVNFPPVIKVPSQLLGAPFGSDLVLRCEIEAMPKYIIQERRNSYKVEMSLTIRSFAKKDVGIYYCVATNSLGKAEGTIRLHDKEIKVHI
ncbi:Lachesin [Orchesella cincta]|uniref:Lachesin n=1 Tax=Orchesella cincta TaxID=48709 RepID=A0A1D2NEW0_ORCCI|nr:Lachesin [Orchesella cincta]